MRDRVLAVANSWVLVAYSVVQTFEQEIVRCGDRCEHGGILIGSYRGPHIEVTELTRPGPADLSGRYRFVKRDALHQRAATYAWQNSGAKDTYIGEWHTHPIGEPSASSVDTRSWRELVRQTKATMVFAVVSPLGWQLFRCENRARWQSIHALSIVESSFTGKVLR